MTRRLFPRLWQFAQWLGGPLAYRGRHSMICQGTLLDIPQPTDFGGFYYDSDPKPLADRAVMTTICQGLCQPLHELPTLANELLAESNQNLQDLVNRFLHGWIRYCMDRSFETGDF